MHTPKIPAFLRTYRQALGFSLSFAALTLGLLTLDRRPLGPGGSIVGLGAINGFFRDLLGVHLFWYHLSDWLGLAALGVALGFALLGLLQLIQRRGLFKVDPDILLLGGFYLALLGVYGAFETWVVNYRPLMLGGYLEASYPSSHTLIVLCIMITGIHQARLRLETRLGRGLAVGCSGVLIGLTVVGRLISGVHWCTDILGGVLAAAALGSWYGALVGRIRS